VFSIEFTTPIWLALLAVMFLGERMTGGRIVAVVFGFAGALVILRPGVAIVDAAALVVLAAALGFAITNVLTKELTNTDPPLAILFYMTIVQLPLSLSLSLWLEDWTNPGLGHAPWLLLVAATGLSAHYCMARALAHGDATIVIPLDFVRLPLIAVVGFVFYAEALELAILLGAVLIFAGNYYSILTESRRRPDPDCR
jgi:drug/metabolite transporter (DMT)-like permease